VDEFYAVVDWSPDGRSIAVGHWQDGTLSIHDVETGVLRGQPIVANAGWVLSIDHADSRHLWVTAGTDGTVRLFDDETLAQVGSNIPGVDNEATTATVTDGGDAMLVVSVVGMGWRWDLDPERWSAQACAVAARTLTVREWHQFLPSLPYDPTCPAGSGTA
jgi:WD40 repeat protein